MGTAALGLAGVPSVHAAAPALGATAHVLVTVRPGAGSSAIIAAGGTVERRLPIIDAYAAQVPAGALGSLAASADVVSVTPDASLHLLSLGTYDPVGDSGSVYNAELSTGVQDMWKAGYTGQGVDVALIDSGVVPVEGLSTPGKIYYGPDLSLDGGIGAIANLDHFGHGTHIAGIIGGRDSTATGPYAGDTADYLGVAPDSRIVSVKVANGVGATDVSEVIAGIDWVVEHRHANGLNIRVINLSFGTTSLQSYTLDPLARAAEAAWRAGIAVVVSAGNEGLTRTGLDDPAFDPYVIAVGASTQAGQPATFTAHGDGVRNPDILAPGTHLASLRDPNSYVDVNYGALANVGTRLTRGSGTSQAAGFVSGAAALLLQQRPGLSPDQLKALLNGSATPVAGALATVAGNGVVNLDAAMAAPTPDPLLATQSFVQSTGRGSLEGARGSLHVTVCGVTISGERNVHGDGVDVGRHADEESNGSSWSSGVWQGITWSGCPQGSSWSGSSWSGSSWSGSSWSGSSWSGSSWSGSSWSGSSWSVSSWSGSSWSVSSWS